VTVDLYPLGKIAKTHGFNGTVVLVSDQSLYDDVERLNELFVVIDGLQVPFPVEELILLSDTSAHVLLEFVSNRDEALKLVGCEVYASIDAHIQELETEYEEWIGFTVHDANYGKIGSIQQIEDYNGNMVMQVMDGNKETLISLYPELITHIDQDAKKIHITAPDGYF
jgi:16S rRNA processing protein RimM